MVTTSLVVAFLALFLTLIRLALVIAWRRELVAEQLEMEEQECTSTLPPSSLSA